MKFKLRRYATVMDEYGDELHYVEIDIEVRRCSFTVSKPAFKCLVRF